MTTNQAIKEIDSAAITVGAQISGNAKDSHLGGALSGEGYAGGYRDALVDVVLLLMAGKDAICRRPEYWR